MVRSVVGGLRPVRKNDVVAKVEKGVKEKRPGEKAIKRGEKWHAQGRKSDSSH